MFVSEFFKEYVVIFRNVIINNISWYRTLQNLVFYFKNHVVIRNKAFTFTTKKQGDTKPL